MKYKELPEDTSPLQMSRRHFLSRASAGIGVAALSSLLPACGKAPLQSEAQGIGGLIQPHHFARAKRVIYLFQSGGPAQMELFDYKPLLR